MPRGNGSYLGHTVNPTASAASGIWTVREAEAYLRADKWPAQPTVPGAPTGTAGNGQVELTWTAPTGGLTPTDYEVQYSSNAGSTWTTFSDGVSSATSATVTGLTNGTGYIFRVRAINALGEGPYGSASGTITPSGLDVRLLMHFDGTNGSTTFTDSSSNAFTVTGSGDAQISTTQSKFGSASAEFTGDGDSLEVGSESSFDFGSDDFTIECWVYISNPSDVNSIVSKRATNESQLAFDFLVLSNSTHLVVSTNGTSWAINGTGNKTISSNQWTHIALVRNGSSFKTYVDGEQASSFTNSSAIFDSSEPLRIGSAGVATQHTVGYIDELRIVKGTAVYTADFTPPTAPF